MLEVAVTSSVGIAASVFVLALVLTASLVDVVREESISEPVTEVKIEAVKSAETSDSRVVVAMKVGAIDGLSAGSLLI